MSLLQSSNRNNKAAIQTMATSSMAWQEIEGTKKSGPILKQPTFNWRVEDQYEQLQNLELEVSNMLQNWLGREGLQLKAT